MEVHYTRLMKGLKKLSEDPSRVWGQPLDALERQVVFSEIWERKREIQKRITQTNINRARLKSRTYNLEQLGVWKKKVKSNKKGRELLIFPGDPEKLCGMVPKKICSRCRNLFYSIEGSLCFGCCLEDYYSLIRGSFIIPLWWEKDSFKVHLLIDALRNEMCFYWWENDSGMLSHQALIAVFDSDDKPSRLTLSTAKKEQKICFTAVFDLLSNGVAGLWYSNSCNSDITKHNSYKSIKPSEFSKVINLKAKMMPLSILTS